MSSSIDTRRWFDKYWQIFLVAFGICFALLMVFYKP
jgi:hypothetical protein